MYFQKSTEQYFWFSILLQDIDIQHQEVESISRDLEPGKYVSIALIEWGRDDSNIDYMKFLKFYGIKDTINKQNPNKSGENT